MESFDWRSLPRLSLPPKLTCTLETVLRERNVPEAARHDIVAAVEAANGLATTLGSSGVSERFLYDLGLAAIESIVTAEPVTLADGTVIPETSHPYLMQQMKYRHTGDLLGMDLFAVNDRVKKNDAEVLTATQLVEALDRMVANASGPLVFKEGHGVAKRGSLPTRPGTAPST